MKVLTSRVVILGIVSVLVMAVHHAYATDRVLTSKTYVDDEVSSVYDYVNGIMVNGASLEEGALYFYGVSSSSANATTKVVDGSAYTEEGVIIVVQPENTHSGTVSSGLTLQLNDDEPAEIIYRGESVTTETAPIIWNADYPSIFVFDGTNWVFAGGGQGTILPTGVTGYVATYTGTTPGTTTGPVGGAVAIATEIQHNGTNGALSNGGDIASVALVDGKQDAIDTGLVNVPSWVPGTPTGTDVPTLLSYGTSDGNGGIDGISGNKIGLLNLADYTSCNSGAVTPCKWGFLPANIVMGADLIQDKVQLKLPQVSAGNLEPRGGQMVALGSTPGDVTNKRYITAGGNKSLTMRSTTPKVIDYVNSSMTLSAFTSGTFGTDNTSYQNEIKNAIVSLELLRDTVTETKKIVFPSTEDEGDYQPAGGEMYAFGSTAAVPKKRYITDSYDNQLTQYEYGLPDEEVYKAYVESYVNGTTTLQNFATYNFGNSNNSSRNKVMNALVNLETLRGMYGALHNEITAVRPSGTANNVATYDSTGALGNGRPAADAPTTNQGGTVTNGTDIATINAVVTRQPMINALPTGTTTTQIVTYPAAGDENGAVGSLIVDTSDLYTTDDSHVPSSKLVDSKKLDKNLVLDTNALDTALGANSSTEGLYSVPGAVSGSNWAATIMSDWADNKNVPTMDTLANALSGLYNAVGANTYNFTATSASITGANIAVPNPLQRYTNNLKLVSGTELLWLPVAKEQGILAATNLLQSYSNNKVVPTMDELAYALYGVMKTRETREEWRAAAANWSVYSQHLYQLKESLNNNLTNAVTFNNTGYLQTFAPTLSALMEESYALYSLISAKQDEIPAKDTNTLVAYSGTQGTFGERAITTSISSSSSDANSIPTNGAVYSFSQVKIPAAGKYRSVYDNTQYNISSWNAAHIKGSAIPTKTTTDGAIGERKIFEATATYTDTDDINIQIPTIGAVMANTLTKICYEYKPGTTDETPENCWLWGFERIPPAPQPQAPSEPLY